MRSYTGYALAHVVAANIQEEKNHLEREPIFPARSEFHQIYKYNSDILGDKHELVTFWGNKKVQGQCQPVITERNLVNAAASGPVKGFQPHLIVRPRSDYVLKGMSPNVSKLRPDEYWPKKRRRPPGFWSSSIYLCRSVLHCVSNNYGKSSLSRNCLSDWPVMTSYITVQWRSGRLESRSRSRWFHFRLRRCYVTILKGIPADASPEPGSASAVAYPEGPRGAAPNHTNIKKIEGNLFRLDVVYYSTIYRV